MAPTFVGQLETQDWMGNVRELENAMRRTLALATGTVLGMLQMTGESGPAESKRAEVKPGVTLQEMERQLLERTLESTGGNRTRAAELMGVSLRTVRNKIREYGLPRRSAP